MLLQLTPVHNAPSKRYNVLGALPSLLLPGTAGVPLEELEYTMAVLNEYLTKVGPGCCSHYHHLPTRTCM